MLWQMKRTKIDDKLKYLQACNPLFPPDANASGGLKVVPVHDDVDEEVEGDWDP